MTERSRIERFVRSARALLTAKTAVGAATEEGEPPAPCRQPEGNDDESAVVDFMCQLALTHSASK